MSYLNGYIIVSWNLEFGPLTFRKGKVKGINLLCLLKIETQDWRHGSSARVLGP
jgi:hypothetical protein